ncbi:hypothetical protein M4I33_15805 [Clostridium sp. LY3-2]|uniref:hypothetical protein n=1 Tax=unclassified Clostridium TaxID=2614128 RepID=UPI002153050B|nr:hypothetical protein [Clostridium sp. LY3-2]MCR6516328.1 hypothetical protein [Clostridium sp. LY3-2]
MKLEEVKEKEVHLNTLQGLELINVINKLGLKDKLKGLVLGQGESGEKKLAYMKLQNDYMNKVIELIETKIPKKEYDELTLEEQTKVLESVMTDEVSEMGAKINILSEEVNNLAANEGFELFYTAVIERFYSNKEIIFKFLSSIFDVKPKELEKQGIASTGVMIKKVMECNDIKEFIEVFL